VLVVFASVATAATVTTYFWPVWFNAIWMHVICFVVISDVSNWFGTQGYASSVINWLDFYYFGS